MQAMARKSGYVGRTADGSRIWLEIELRPQQNVTGRQTTEHTPASEGLELSISGMGVSKGHRRVDRAGQIDAEVGRIVSPAEGWTVVELRKLVKVWDRWHLNGLKVGCAHMPANARVGETECPVQAADPKVEKPYVHGTEWLIEPLPDDVIKQVRTWAARLDGTEPRG
jgi:hypothetical protein